MAERIEIIAIEGVPLLRPGDDVAGLLLQALGQQGERIQTGDVVVVCSKIVAKAEGRLVRLSEVDPSPLAIQIATEGDKDPRLVEVVLRESRRIVRMDRGVLIAETRHGFVCANAGVDQSNVDGGETVCLLPVDGDRSARRLRETLLDECGVEVGVIICDSVGRPWRVGQGEVAIGVAGLGPLEDFRGRQDLFSYRLRDTQDAVADGLAAASGLLFRKDSGIPACIVRGYSFVAGDEGGVSLLLREREKDLFR